VCVVQLTLIFLVASGFEEFFVLVCEPIFFVGFSLFVAATVELRQLFFVFVFLLSPQGQGQVFIFDSPVDFLLPRIGICHRFSSFLPPNLLL
jgi:hypothetical protein